VHGFELSREFDDFGGVVAARAGEHGSLSIGFLKRNFNDAKVFLAGESGIFAGGAARNEEIDPSFDLPPHQPAERVFVQGTIVLKWSY
jgi:hypothetical protein